MLVKEATGILQNVEWHQNQQREASWNDNKIFVLWDGMPH